MEWISVEDRLPDSGNRVAVWVVDCQHDEEGPWIGVYKEAPHYVKGKLFPKGWYLPYGDGIPTILKKFDEDLFVVTHWMPLPDGPGAVCGEDGCQIVYPEEKGCI